MAARTRTTTGQEKKNKKEQGADAHRAPLRDAIVVVSVGPTGPAAEDLIGGAPPDFCGNRGVQVQVDSPSSRSAPSSRNALAESAKNGERTTVRTAIRAPHERLINYILPLERVQVGPVIPKLLLNHGLSAIQARVDSIRRSDADVKSGLAVAESKGKDVRWPKPRARD